jgi:pyroglutamyl-peptidase
MKLLLTGFGPFPGVPVNASGLLLARIARAARAAWPQLSTHTATLPTEWRRGPARSESAIRRLKPDVVLHFGVSARARGLVLERIGTSACLVLPDAVGALPAPATSSAPVRCRASLPFDAIVARLRALHLPVALSDDAGSYLCNAVLYRTLALPDGLRPRVAGFIHIPASLAGFGTDGRGADPAAPMTQAEAVDGALAIIDVCLAGLPAPRACSGPGALLAASSS